MLLLAAFLVVDVIIVGSNGDAGGDDGDGDKKNVMTEETEERSAGFDVAYRIAISGDGAVLHSCAQIIMRSVLSYFLLLF
mmetsp:Transcript_17297/g.31334  ORF Transcript_17297/g.31334 Transcript_17297/m.31334 type:complete len:80 (+) Transcript_17297:2211-2450(+)